MTVISLVALAMSLSAQQGVWTEREIAFGAGLERDIAIRSNVVSAGAAYGYAQSTARTLARHLAQPSMVTSVLFYIPSDAGDRQALGLPGGRILIPMHLLADSRDDAEFAGAIAQAIGRIEGYAANSGRVPKSQPLIFTGALKPDGMPGGFTRTSQASELQADVAAVGLMRAAGLVTTGVLGYVRRLGTRAASNPFVSPLFEERVDKLIALTAKDPRRDESPSREFIVAQESIRSFVSSRKLAPSLAR